MLAPHPLRQDPLAVTEANVTELLDPARPAGTNAYRVCATNAAGDSPWVARVVGETPRERRR